MNKLLLILLLFNPVICEEAQVAPSDLVRMNHFGDEYNKYIGKLNEGVRDIKQWEKVKKAWKEIE